MTNQDSSVVPHPSLYSVCTLRITPFVILSETKNLLNSRKLRFGADDLKFYIPNHKSKIVILKYDFGLPGLAL